MAWSIQEIKELILQRPKLGIALIQMMAERSDGFGSRLESFAVDSILRRLLRSLLGLSDKLGQQAEDGSVQIIPLTHQFLSQYLGTSREIVTHHMKELVAELSDVENVCLPRVYSSPLMSRGPGCRDSEGDAARRSI